LYDFSGSVGDSLEMPACLYNWITDIDTVYLGNEPRKRFHFPHPSVNEIATLIEGIGSTLGFYLPGCNFLPIGLPKLQCFCQDGNCIQFDTSYDCSSLVLGTEPISKNKISIFPNPFIEEIYIQFEDPQHQEAILTIINFMGEIVHESKLQAFQSEGQVRLPDLQPGFYIINVRDKTGIESYKILKL
jgi:hypothetical protein